MHWLYSAIFMVIIGIVAACAAVMLIHGYFMMRNKVPYVRLPEGAMDQVAAELGVRMDDVVYDLGCGDGRVLANLRRRNPAAQYVGIENDWTVWLLAKLRRHGLKLHLGDIARADLSDAARVFAYLGPDMMKQLEPRFERELPAGSRVVTVQFPLPARKPDKVVDLTNSAPYAARLYVYNY